MERVFLTGEIRRSRKCHHRRHGGATISEGRCKEGKNFRSFFGRRR
ncbi:hypothetical protein HanPSC8_Chr06g0250211 [Helianthus annuus]|nr:hypothetical protein HanLR1_Chr06g0212471 [Helianthus annuus]KAJ0915472.1 hypothetical protein HanPSC8_Chr06g0250211 [Helianthus annuus]